MNRLPKDYYGVPVPPPPLTPRCHFCDKAADVSWWITTRNLLTAKIRLVAWNGIDYYTCRACQDYFNTFVTKLLKEMKRNHGPLSKTVKES